ncbi:MAG: DUF190 domain-containing protein [Geminicoccaceae bacterium]|nr:DUF190 domain-containing protein [Geminicoccaceae bacterium]
MPALRPARRLRVFVSERARHGGRPLFEAVLQRARELGLAGGTVFRGAMGFGRFTQLHRPGILEIAEDLPLLVEIVDEAAKIDHLLGELETMIGHGLAVLDDVEIALFGPAKPPA